MAKKLEVGMWCWIVKSPDYKESIGKPVVIKKIRSHPGSFNYFCEGEGLSGWDMYSCRKVKTGYLWAKADNLIPINDPDIDVSDIESTDMTKELANA